MFTLPRYEFGHLAVASNRLSTSCCCEIYEGNFFLPQKAVNHAARRDSSLASALSFHDTTSSLKMSSSTLPAAMQDLRVENGVEPAPFPATSKQAAGLVNGTPTDVSSVYFADKILITISQGGRLSQWVCPRCYSSYASLIFSQDTSSSILRLSYPIRYRSAFRQRRHASARTLNTKDAAWCRW